MRVHPGILDHLWRQRALSPICKLILLIRKGIAIVIEEVSIWELGITEYPWGFISIKEIGNIDIKIPLQPLNIHLRTMHDLDNSLVLDDLAQQGDIFPDREHINNIILPSRTNLNQTSQSLITFVTVLKINCYLFAWGQLDYHFLQWLLCWDVR